MTTSCYFNGESGTRFDLTETNNIFIIRTSSGTADQILDSPALAPYQKSIVPFVSFSECFVYLYKCVGTPQPAALRDEIKRLVRAEKHPKLRYIGSILKFSGSDIYQIYTGNLFIKFFDQVKQPAIANALSKSGVYIKTALSFAKNSFFAEPRLDIGQEVFDLSRQMLTHPDVEFCHPELVVNNRSFFSGSDTSPEPLTDQESDWILNKTRVKHAWEITQGKGVRICIIDDGLEFGHPAFSGPGKILFPIDMQDKTRTRLPYHQFGDKHGTACASIACSNDINSYGVAPGASLIPIRVTGLGSVLQSEAFYWAVENQADIISCSWGPPDGSIFTLADNDFVFPIPDHTNLAFRYAAKYGRKGKGTIIVFAAGNGKELVKNDGYAAHEDVIAVGSVNKIDQPTVYSDYGYPLFCCFPSGDYSIISDAQASKLYGVKVADRIGPEGYSLNDYYDFFDGTSASCPGIAGIVALMLSANPQLSRGDVKEIIKDSCRKIGSPQDYLKGYSEKYGYGLLMADLAVKNALNYKSLSNNIAMEIAPQLPSALSLHIGINNVDPAYYQGFVPPLAGCVNDMLSMQKFADSLGYKSKTLSNEQATREAILECIKMLGNSVAAGGILLITYAGHGAPIPDTDNTEETDANDESWVTYNGFLIDDELNQCLTSVPAGVRVLIVSDSCHSATVSRFVDLNSRIRCINLDTVKMILKANNQKASTLKAGLRGAGTEPKAFVKLLSACKDSQFAKETGGAGVFTTRLIQHFNKLKSSGQATTYADFIKEIQQAINDQTQEPGVSNTGATSPEFDNQHPFSTTSLASKGVSAPNSMAVEAPKVTLSATEASPAVVSAANGFAANGFAANGSASNGSETNGFSTNGAANETVLIVKTAKKYLKKPKKGSLRAVGMSLPDVKITNGTIDSTDLEGETEWDKAYNLMLINGGRDIDFVEPDMASNVYADTSMLTQQGSRALLDSGYLNNYPNPQENNSPNPFIWHLDNEHSQLKEANAIVFPEILFEGEPADAAHVVKIAHIDTGYLPRHPANPENLDPAAATFTQRVRFEGATDFDVPLFPAEQQGHGNATMAILAGGRLSFEDTMGEYQGYFGAIPFARVLALKVSESVALLSGKNFAAAVEFAIEQNCDVITMSMAGLPSKTMADAVNKAYEAGIVIVSAAGNSFVKGVQSILPKTTLYPARYDRVISAVGAAFDHKPYLFDIHNPGSRGMGGEFMQMNFGPDAALATTLAAYTPNLSWFDCKEDEGAAGVRYFVKSGGGTSSATPQIAAAAALYIQHYRKQLDEIAGDEKWKKVELVKAALFSSAFKPDIYKSYYGNGILRAKNALAKAPASFPVPSRKAQAAQGEGNIFKRLFRLFSGRSAFDNSAQDLNAKLQDMMGVELIQLLYRDQKLHGYLDQINFDGGDNALDGVTDIESLVKDIQNSSKASLFLKQQLVTSSKGRSIISSDSDFNNYILSTNNGEIQIKTSGIQCAVSNIKTNQTYENAYGVEFHEFEIEVGGVSTSRGIDTSLNITDTFADNEMESVMLLERQVGDDTILEWKLKGQSAASGTRGLHGAGKDQFTIDISQFDAGGSRGPFKKAAKMVVKIFSWIKPGKKQTAKPIVNLLEDLVDSKYEILVYDLQGSQPGETGWVNESTVENLYKSIMDEPRPLLMLLPGLFSTVQKGFDEFLGNPLMIQALSAKYGRFVLGLNMPTLTKSIEDNGRELHDLLSKTALKQKHCTVIGRSRGGIVGRHLFEELWVNPGPAGGPKPKAPLVLDKLIFTGTPNQGTMIASHENWSSMINIVTNVANLALGTFVPVLPKITSVIKAILNQIILLPGIHDLEEQSAVILRLNALEINRNNYFSLTSNFEPNGFLKKLFDQNIVDKAIFKGQLNDAIAPLNGAIFKNTNLPCKATLAPGNFHICGDLDSINHFSYLKPQNKVILEKVISWL